ncbi:alpha/beta hydrolase family protein [Embleya sp. NPDC055664]
MEAYARAGYATLSWNKPGVAGSPGNWLDQSMEDRARETEAAIAWSRSRPDVDHARVGLWGAGQAGWVLPKVAARTPDVEFVIAVSPAINWLRQAGSTCSPSCARSMRRRPGSTPRSGAATRFGG